MANVRPEVKIDTVKHRIERFAKRNFPLVEFMFIGSGPQTTKNGIEACYIVVLNDPNHHYDEAAASRLVRNAFPNKLIYVWNECNYGY